MTGKGAEALALIDQVLARRPHKDDHALAAATECLAQFRDELVQSPTSDRTRLAHLNAILSVVIGVHFPLGNPPYEELEKARAWLADLIGRPHR